MREKVTLFWPSTLHYDEDTPYPSLPMAYLSKVLENDGVDVSVVDGGTLFPKSKFLNESEQTLKKLLKITEDTNPQVLGVGGWTLNMPFVAEFTKEFKARNPDIKIVLGSYNATFLSNETLNFLPQVDFLVRGEGEVTISELIKVIGKGNVLKRVKGISYRNKNGRIVHNPDRPLMMNLDDLPLIDFENFVNSDKFKTIKMEIMTSRGCPFKCIFCTVNAMWEKQRSFSVDYVLKQIAHLRDLYDFSQSSMVFADDNLFANLTRLKKLSVCVHKKFPDTAWGAVARVETVSRDLIKFITGNGFNGTFLGVESIIPQSLLFLNKTRNPVGYIERTYKSLDILEEFNQGTGLGIIVGAPNESKEDIIKTVEFVKHIKDNYKFIFPTLFHLTLFPGTNIWEKYHNGEIDVFKAKMRNPAFVTFREMPFEDKYEHLVWMTPSKYLIKNNTMSNEEYENVMLNSFDFYKDGAQ